MPEPGEWITVALMTGSTMVVPAVIIFLIVKAWGASQRRQDEQIGLLHDIARNLERIGKRVETIETKTPHDGRKELVP